MRTCRTLFGTGLWLWLFTSAGCAGAVGDEEGQFEEAEFEEIGVVRSELAIGAGSTVAFTCDSKTESCSCDGASDCLDMLAECEDNRFGWCSPKGWHCTCDWDRSNVQGGGRTALPVGDRINSFQP